MKKNIVIVATGGTIAGTSFSATDTLHYTSASISVDELLAKVPYLQEIANVTGIQLAQVDSSNITMDIWLELSKTINNLLISSDVDGVVITHGTDTLEETAYFLNLTIKHIKPVVIVGAMRPISALSADGPINLYNAVRLAASPSAHNKGVLVTLNDTINYSRDVTKTNTALQDAFKAPELGYLGYIQGGQPYFYRLPARRHTKYTEFNLSNITVLPKVEIIYSYVDSDPYIIEAAVTAGTQGLIYAGLGNGGIPDKTLKVLANLACDGLPIVRSSRVGSGVVTRNDAVSDDTYGFIVADTLNPQKARVLLTLALTVTTDISKIQQMFFEY